MVPTAVEGSRQEDKKQGGKEGSGGKLPWRVKSQSPGETNY